MSEHLTCLEDFIASLGDVLKSGTGKVEGIGGAWGRWRIAPVVRGRHRRLRGVLDIADPQEGQGWLVETSQVHKSLIEASERRVPGSGQKIPRASIGSPRGAPA